MTAKDFVYWLRGYAQAADHSITPGQWEDVKQMLTQVQEEEKITVTRYTSETGGWDTTHTGGDVTITATNSKQLLKTEPNY